MVKSKYQSKKGGEMSYKSALAYLISHHGKISPSDLKNKLGTFYEEFLNLGLFETTRNTYRIKKEAKQASEYLNLEQIYTPTMGDKLQSFVNRLLTCS